MIRTDDIFDDGLAAEEAAGWFARLQGEAATGDDWLAFERWLQASPTHARAYDRLEGLWVELEYAPLAKELGGRPLIAARRRAPVRASRRPAPPRRAPFSRVWYAAG